MDALVSSSPLDPPTEPCSLGSFPMELVIRLLTWLPAPSIVRASSCSRSWFKIAPSAIRMAKWSGRKGEDWPRKVGGGATDMGEKRDVGPPFLDLCCARDAVTDRALEMLLGIFRVTGGAADEKKSIGAYSERGDLNEKAQCGTDTNCERNRMRGQVDGHIPLDDPPSLRGLLISSANVSDEALQQALASHGADLEVLGLGGCIGLGDPSTPLAIARHCGRGSLLDLDLSNTFQRQSELWMGLGGSNSQFFRYVSGAQGPHEARYTLLNGGLERLLEGVGEHLLSLRLFNCPGLTDCGPGIARCCPCLRELDIGIGPDNTNNVDSPLLRTRNTNQALSCLAGANCAATLVYLGLRGCNDLGIAGLELLATAFPRLERLDLAGVTRVDDSFLKDLTTNLITNHKGTVALKEISLSWCSKITVTGITSLAMNSPDLRGICLHGTAIGDEGVRSLCRSCQHLRWINLSLTKVTGRALRSLAMRDTLRNLLDSIAQGGGVFERAVELRQRLAASSWEGGGAHLLERPKSCLGHSASHSLTSTSSARCMQYAHPQNSAFACTPCATNPPEVFRASGVVPSHPVLRASFSHTAEAAVIPHAIPRMENSGSSVDAPQSTVTTFAGPRAVHGPVVARTLTPAHAPQSLRGNIPSPLPGVDRHCLPWPHGRVNANSMKNTFEDTMQSSWPRVQGHRSRSEGGSNRGQGRGQGTPRPGEKEEASSVAFDWHLVPRGCGAGELASWGGFRGFPGDVARAVILWVKSSIQSAQIDFIAGSDSSP